MTSMSFTSPYGEKNTPKPTPAPISPSFVFGSSSSSGQSKPEDRKRRTYRRLVEINVYPCSGKTDSGSKATNASANDGNLERSLVPVHPWGFRDSPPVLNS